MKGSRRNVAPFLFDLGGQVDEKVIKAVEAVLAKGYAVELRPVKDGVKVIQVIRQQVAKQ